MDSSIPISDPGKLTVAFVIFGASGDLTRRKLIPALYELAVNGRLVHPLKVIGFARRVWSDEQFRGAIRASAADHAGAQPLQPEALESLVQSACYVSSDFGDLEGYARLKQVMEAEKICRTVYYLAAPPESYPVIINNLGRSGLEDHLGGWCRIVIEKPYGNDLASAQKLDVAVHAVFEEKQVYRIDHFLGKETVQNILVLRFANGIFEPLWNRRYVDHVQITVAENLGVDGRAGYYETAGVIRDIFQNHMLQLLCLTAMEAPVAFSADDVRNEKVKVLQALRPWAGQEALVNTCRGQYTSGMVNGKSAVGYKEEKGVSPDSVVETYLAMRVFVDNWRWAGVPFYLRSGKRLPRKLTEIAIQFAQVPLSLFGWRNMAGSAPNLLVLNIQPDEGITLTFGAKGPGPEDKILPVKMDFNYAEDFGMEPPEAYQRLIMDVLEGDATLFTRQDEVRAAWEFVDRIIQAWKEAPQRSLPEYAAGSWGPPGTDEFIARDGCAWFNAPR